VVVAARDEAQRIAATIAALRRALPGAAIVVADDGSRDRTAEIARALGARVVSAGRHVGKGRAMSLASASALESAREPNGACASVFLLCDGDLAESAGELAALVRAVGREQADLAIGAPTRRVGGGFGIAVGFARRALRAGCGLRLDAPMSGPRALELDFSHRSGGRTPAEFAHRGVQLAHMLRAYRARIGAGSEGATRDARARGVTLRAL
jgi:glycosyltransferase involved in cell wall biosynthesis